MAIAATFVSASAVLASRSLDLAAISTRRGEEDYVRLTQKRSLFLQIYTSRSGGAAARAPPQPAHRLAARLHDLDAPALQRALRLGRAVAQPLLRPLLAPPRAEEQAALEGRERRRRLAQAEQRPPLVRGRVRVRGRLG